MNLISKKIVSIVVCSVTSFTLTGCRPSDALVDKVFTADASEVDWDNETSVIDNNKNNKEKDDELSPKDLDEKSSDLRDRERNNPIPGKDTNKDSSPNVVTDINANSDLTPKDKTTQSNNSEENDGTNTDNISDITKPIGDEIGGNGNNVDGGINSDDDGTPRDIVNAYGDVIEVPENVEHVTAVGDAALIVQMLGADNRLVASSSNIINDALAKNVFANEGLSQVSALWEGNGSTSISDNNFQELLVKQPQACFEISGQNTFTENQIATLKQNSIAYIALPDLKTTGDICQAVEIVGTVLGNQNGIDAQANAKEYIDYFNSTISYVSSKVNRFTYKSIDFDNNRSINGIKYLSNNTSEGHYSLYIMGWDNEAQYKLHNNSTVALQGNGMAAVLSGYSYSPTSYYMSIGGVVNAASTYIDYGTMKNWYANPITSVDKLLTVNGGHGALSDYTLTKVDNAYLGESLFPAIIVENNAIRDQIMKSDLWKNYGPITSSTGLTKDYGFLDASGSIVTSSIRGDYDILVNPQGVGSWTSGSVESILEPIWIASKFSNSISEDELKTKIKEFYKKFYRYDLNDSQVDNILKGN